MRTHNAIKTVLSAGTAIRQASQKVVLHNKEAASVKEITERENLRQIAEVTRMLGKQGIPFRGHDESLESNKREFLGVYGAPENV